MTHCHNNFTIKYHNYRKSLNGYPNTQYSNIRTFLVKQDRNCLLFASTSVQYQGGVGKGSLVGSVLLILLDFFVVLCFWVCLSSSCVLCTHCCQCLWMVYSWFSFRIFPTCICSSDVYKYNFTKTQTFSCLSLSLPQSVYFCFDTLQIHQ
jgi:hypothetical protein